MLFNFPLDDLLFLIRVYDSGIRYLLYCDHVAVNHFSINRLRGDDNCLVVHYCLRYCNFLLCHDLIILLFISLASHLRPVLVSAVEPVALAVYPPGAAVRHSGLPVELKLTGRLNWLAVAVL